MGLELVSAWVLSFFGACAVGGLVGFLVGRFARFETGLGVGLLLPGVVSLAYTATFAQEYVAVSRGPHRATGTVLVVEDRAVNASGSVTTPTPVVGFAVDGVDYRVDGRGGTSLGAGDTVTVVYDPADPRRARFAVADEMVGGGIASMLFGVFPFSAGLFFLLESVLSGHTVTARDLSGRRLTIAGNVLLVGGILWMGIMEAPIEELFLEGFAIVSLGLWVHCLHGLFGGADPRWTAGIGVLAVNFTAWVVALWLLIFVRGAG